RVDACRDVPTSFARAIGFTSTHVCAHATALKQGSTGGGGGGGGTSGSDPDAPCTVDDFLPLGYFDSNSPPNALNDPTADSNHSGGAPGGSVGEGKIVGATFFSTSDIDYSGASPTKVPYFYLQNVTSGAAATYYSYVADNNPASFHIHAMTQVKPNNIPVNGAPPVTYLYQIQWKIPSGNANNAKYTIGMGVYDKTNGLACGKATWSFVKGNPPASGGTCGENSFLASTTPPQGSTVTPGQTVGADYEDESPINTNVNPNGPGFQVIFTIDGVAVPYTIT